MTQTPATPEDENMALNELMEHRDPQNAQVGSMAHIWDNPADERWNDLSLIASEASVSGQEKPADQPPSSGKPAP